ncbi:hypothetical protein B0H11DRAFT_800474 [Mycena galericulata]|nr:hypothetical protein B0H11DRAFT_800474 [Mycena galericulata]
MCGMCGGDMEEGDGRRERWRGWRWVNSVVACSTSRRTSAPSGKSLHRETTGVVSRKLKVTPSPMVRNRTHVPRDKPRKSSALPASVERGLPPKPMTSSTRRRTCAMSKALGRRCLLLHLLESDPRRGRARSRYDMEIWKRGGGGCDSEGNHKRWDAGRLFGIYDKRGGCIIAVLNAWQEAEARRRKGRGRSRMHAAPVKKGASAARGRTVLVFIIVPVTSATPPLRHHRPQRS